MKRQDQHHAPAARLEIARQVLPHPQRTRLIRDWHLAQSGAEHESVASLTMTITDCGQVKTTGLAIEPEHALIFLSEIEAVSNRLRAFIEARRLSPDPGADIVPFERRA